MRWLVLTGRQKDYDRNPSCRSTVGIITYLLGYWAANAERRPSHDAQIGEGASLRCHRHPTERLLAKLREPESARLQFRTPSSLASHVSLTCCPLSPDRAVVGNCAERLTSGECAWGSHRIIYRIDDAAQLIEVQAIRDRKDATSDGDSVGPLGGSGVARLASIARASRFPWSITFRIRYRGLS